MKSLRFTVYLFVLCALFSCHKSLQKIVKDTEPATFIIYTYDEFGSPQGIGSGFFIERDGTGVTNWHVLDHSIKAVIKTNEGKQYEIDTVLCASSKKDLLVFRVKNPHGVQFKTLSFCDELPPKGAPVYNIGSPCGMESSVSEGIVASYRSDAHGDIVQTTAPISPGASGSPLLNERGEVFAVTTFKRVGGENLNFGVLVSNDFRDELDEKEFYKKNRKFNSEKSDFIILNLASDKGSDYILNAIEFGTTATTLYMTFTNLHLNEDMKWPIWAATGQKNKGFYLEDVDSKQRYYITSSTLPTAKKNAKKIGLAETYQFKVYFPAIKTEPREINVMWGEGIRMPHYSNIILDDYRAELSIDDYNYRRETALRYTTERGDAGTTISILEELLDENPSDAISLNMMALLHIVLENKSTAMYYLETAIDENPNDELAFLNRATIFEIEDKYEEAICELTTAISISPDQPDYYLKRAEDYFQLENYHDALTDVNKALELAEEGDGYLDNCGIYALRAWINYRLHNISAARRDCQTAYRLSEDPRMDRLIENLYALL